MAQPTLRDYLRIAFRRKYLIIIPFCVITFSGIVLSLILPKYYSARAILLIEDKKLLKSAFKKVSLNVSLDEKLQMVKTEMLSWNNVYDLIQQLGLDIEEQADSPLKIQRLIQKIQANTQVNLTGYAPGSTVLQISFRGKVPSTVQKYVNTLSGVYVEKQLARQNEDTDETIKFLQRQTEQYRDKIEQSEKRVLKFKNTSMSNLVGSSSLNKIGQDLLRLQDTLAQYSIQMKASMQRKKVIIEQLTGQKQMIIGESTKLANPAALAIQNRIQERQTELDFMLLRYTHEHPEVVKMQGLITLDEEKLKRLEKEIQSGETLQQNPIYQSLIQQQMKAEVDIENYTALRDGVLDLIREREDRIRQSQAIEAELGIMTRDTGVARDVYKELRIQLENSKITKRLDSMQKGIRYEILEPARLPLTPASPNRPKIWILSMLLGLACGAALVFWAEINDHSFRGPEDVSLFLKVPLLGVIPNLLSFREVNKEKKKSKAAWAFAIALLLSVGIFISSPHFGGI